MGLFESKATRIARHRELIELARMALDTLKVSHTVEGVAEPVWPDQARSVPLEFRSFVLRWTEDMVFQVHDSTMHENLGDRDCIRSLEEDLTGVRTYLAGMPTDVRSAFRATTFAALLKEVEKEISELSEGIATGNPFIVVRDQTEWSAAGRFRRKLEECREALAWFPTSDALRATNALRSKADRREHPELHRHSMQEAIARGEVVVEQLEALWSKAGAIKPRDSQHALVVAAESSAPETVKPAPAIPPAEALRQLAALRADGLITESEYQTKRAEILARL